MNNPQRDLLTSHDAADLIDVKYETFRKRMYRGPPAYGAAMLGGQ